MEKERPAAFLFYARDWLSSAKTRLMTPEERGGYIDLLAHAWLAAEPGVLPDDDRVLAVLSGLGDRYPACRDGIRAAWDSETRPGFLIQPKMREVREAQRRRLTKASLMGKASAEARWAQRDGWAPHHRSRFSVLGSRSSVEPNPLNTCPAGPGETSPETGPPDSKATALPHPAPAPGPASPGGPGGAGRPPGAPPGAEAGLFGPQDSAGATGAHPGPGGGRSPRGRAGAAFEAFWSAWPRGRKAGRLAAERAYARALARGADPAVILRGLERAKLSQRWADGYVKDPATWLNQGCWDDELAPAAARGASAVDQFIKGGDA